MAGFATAILPAQEALFILPPASSDHPNRWNQAQRSGPVPDSTRSTLLGCTSACRRGSTGGSATYVLPPVFAIRESRPGCGDGRLRRGRWVRPAPRWPSCGCRAGGRPKASLVACDVRTRRLSPPAAQVGALKVRRPCRFSTPVVTARARRAPAVPGVIRTQRGPLGNPVPSGRGRPLV
jgi:hypothetical protein